MARSVWWLVLTATLAAGCGLNMPREQITLAVLSGAYYAAEPADAAIEGAVVEDSEVLLTKAVADLNAAKKVDFVLVAGDLLARGDALSLDRARAILSTLRMPYHVVLGITDGPGPLAEKPAGTASPAAKPPAPGAVSQATVVWAFQGHGFTGPEGYWSREVLPGILMIGLDTVQPGQRGGHVDPRQLVWLERTLTENAGKTVLVAAYHGLVPLHPLQEAAGWKHMTVDNAAAVLKVLDRHPNVVLMISGSNHFAAGQVSGRTVHLSGPSVSVWPLAYQLVRLTRKEVEPAWVPLGSEEMSRRAQERLLASPRYRGVFPLGEDGDTACIRLFGSKKTEVFALPGIRP